MILHTANRGIISFWNCLWWSSPCHPCQEKFAQQQPFQMESAGVTSSNSNQSVICAIRTPVWILCCNSEMFQCLPLWGHGLDVPESRLYCIICLSNARLCWWHVSKHAMFSLGAVKSNCIHNTPTTHPQFLALEIHVCTWGLLLHPQVWTSPGSVSAAW